MTTLGEYEEDLRWQELFREQLRLGDAQGNPLTMNMPDVAGSIIPSYWSIPHERLNALVERLAGEYNDSPDKLKRFLRTSPSMTDCDNFASGIASTVLDYITGNPSFMIESFGGGLGAVVENLRARNIPASSFIQSRISNSFHFCDIGKDALVGARVVDSFVGSRCVERALPQLEFLEARGISFFGADVLGYDLDAAFEEEFPYQSISDPAFDIALNTPDNEDHIDTRPQFFDFSGFGAIFGYSPQLRDSAGTYSLHLPILPGVHIPTYHRDHVNRMPRNLLVQCLLRGFSILYGACSEQNPVDEAVKYVPEASRSRAEDSLSSLVVALDIIAERSLTVYNSSADAEVERLVCSAIAPFDIPGQKEHPLLPVLNVLNRVYVVEKRLNRGIVN